jgi:hypothetical protein
MTDQGAIPIKPIQGAHRVRIWTVCPNFAVDARPQFCLGDQTGIPVGGKIALACLMFQCFFDGR